MHLPPFPLTSGSRPARLIAVAVLAAGVLAANADGANAAPKVKAKVKHRTLIVTGTRSADRIALRLRAGHPDVLQVDVRDNGSADFTFDRDRFDEISVKGRRGGDQLRIDDGNGAFTDAVPTTLDGGAGGDTLSGGAGRETLIAGSGADHVDGGRGDDIAVLGRGADTFQWDPGEGSDVVEGQSGADTMDFNGANVGESFDVSKNGGRVRFFRDVASITMDLDGVERIRTAALGGADTFTAHDLSGTGVTELDTDLAGASAPAPDTAADHIVVEGTDGADTLEAQNQPGALAVTGGAARLRVTNADATDQLEIRALDGRDVVTATTLRADAVKLTIDGGAERDTILGGAGADVILGGDGDDHVAGGRGDDLVLLGAGDDTFDWDPGEGNDTVEGQGGHDEMEFNGSNVGESFDVSANGARVRFTRDVASITMDLDDVEQITTAALGGADTFTAHDLSGTDLTELDANLAGTGGAGDGAGDRVNVDGTDGNDVASVTGSAGDVRVAGLQTLVRVTHAEAPDDRLAVRGLGGDDVIDASGLAANGIAFTGEGGAGDDVLIGGLGDDTLKGGDGDDVLIGGVGTDTLDGGSGDNIVIQ